jgi:hypothetical protein
VPERVDDEAVAIARSGIGFGVAVCDICSTPSRSSSLQAGQVGFHLEDDWRRSEYDSAPELLVGALSWQNAAG